METPALHIIYQDAKGNITAREVADITETDDYLQAYCLKAKALRTFKKERILERSETSHQASERLAHHQQNPPPLKPKPRKNTALSICFTGFIKADKERLVNLAEGNGLSVKKTVTKDLHFLCGGFNAGPTKLRTAREQGALVLDEYQLIELINTGEVPDFE